MAKFKVLARLDRTGGEIEGTVTITKEHGGMVTVRPHRSRDVYELPLGDVATMVCNAVIRARNMEKGLTGEGKRRMRKVKRGVL